MSSDFKLAAVEAKCRELLRTVDVETLSERQIREILAQDLGFPMDEFKPLILSLVDEFVQKERAEEEEVLRLSIEPSGKAQEGPPPSLSEGA